jgi:hypothetical protein
MISYLLHKSTYFIVKNVQNLDKFFVTLSTVSLSYIQLTFSYEQSYRLRRDLTGHEIIWFSAWNIKRQLKND